MVTVVQYRPHGREVGIQTGQKAAKIDLAERVIAGWVIKRRTTSLITGTADVDMENPDRPGYIRSYRGLEL